MRRPTAREPDYRVLGSPNPPRNAEQLRLTSAEQRGLLTRRQCLEAGMSSKSVRWKLERGLWVRVHPGVYQTLPGKDDWHTGAMAGLLAVPGSAWSHRTAGFVHGLLTEAPEIIELIVDERRRVVAPMGVKAYRRVDADTFVDDLHWPWRVTAGDTLLDLAEDGTSGDTLANLGR
ncbi:MAG TPA: type IV toxin-antitoxin system AbiEi family antitoxin domain-containing protein, partial [Lapillicoccus sp.]|nr:type IV toxin-antitoxin system AbiEi family antitoxin domain-containing protein [Lapillicoccus sp.]